LIKKCRFVERLWGARGSPPRSSRWASGFSAAGDPDRAATALSVLRGHRGTAALSAARYDALEAGVDALE
jgi:hypothetical protein